MRTTNGTSIEELESTLKTVLKLTLQEVDGSQAMKAMTVPLSFRNAVTINFTFPPTKSEIDALTSFIQSIAGFAPEEPPTDDLYAQIIRQVQDKTGGDDA